MEMMKYFLKSLIDWMFRQRSPALRVMWFGLACTGLALGGGWALNVSIPFQDGPLHVGFNTAGGTPALLVYGIYGAGLILLIGSFAVWVCCCVAERRQSKRKKIIVIEARGLRDTAGTPLVEAIPNSLKGYRESVLVDICQQIRDGEVVDPTAALENLISLPSDLKRREAGFDRRDLTLVYGGLAPVPFTFLAGVLMDDESTITVFDWDRYTGTWKDLEGSDDGKRFKCKGLDDVPDGVPDVALAVSVSYHVRAEDVRAKVGEIPFASLDLEGGSTDCHWSEAKQRALGKQFHEVVVNLGDRGVARIHLFLAAQNSVVFRFGRLYDKRNLPEVVVYQYQKASVPPYPWGILMPVCGISQPSLLGAVPLVSCRSS